VGVNGGQSAAYGLKPFRSPLRNGSSKNVAVGSSSEARAGKRYVRSSPTGRHSLVQPACLKGGISRPHASLFDHFVSKRKQRRWNVDTKRLCRS
jgi:hypothetical protein